MKRIISFITAMILCLGLLTVTVFAASATASLTGPATIQEGQTLTVKLNVNASDIYGFSGKLSYDSEQLTLKNYQTKAGANWAAEFYNNKFVAYDNLGESPINGNKTLLTLTFKVKAAAGTVITVSFGDLMATDAANDVPVGAVSYSCTVVEAPKPTTPPATEPPATEAPTTEPPTEEPTVAPTEEPTEAPTVAPTEEPTEEPTDAPTEPTVPDEGEKHCCLPWWLLILVGVICLVLGYFIGAASEKKRRAA